jgi:hypothetical protein
MTRTRVPRALLLPALAAAIVLAVPAAPVAAKARCAPAKAKTLKRTGKVRVYRKGSGTYACWYRTGRTTRIDDYPREPDTGDGGGTDELIGHIVVSGAYVAYTDDVTIFPTGTEEEGGQQPEHQSSVEVLNVKRGGDPVAEAEPYGEAAGSQYLEATSFTVVRLVLRPTGAAAWTAASSTDVVVNAMNAGATRLLDQGAGIDARSLRLAGKRLSWTKSGARRSGTL